jgi:hypothetical protein
MIAAEHQKGSSFTPVGESTKDSQMNAKRELRALLNDAISRAVNANSPLASLRGVACFNMERDDFFKCLERFDATATAITALPNFGTRFGEGAEIRILLQFLYQYFSRIDELRLDDTVFEELWTDFSKELGVETWLNRGVANLRFFQANSAILDLGDGISIRGRNPEDLPSLGFDDAIFDRISEDCQGLALAPTS